MKAFRFLEERSLHLLRNQFKPHPSHARQAFRRQTTIPFVRSSQASNTYLSQYKSLHTYLRSIRQSLPRRFRQVRQQSTKQEPGASPSPDPTSQLGSPDGPLSLSQRFKKLSREYGWSAFWVYMGLTCVDLPLCFLAVRLIGTEKVGQAEQWVVSKAKYFLVYPFHKAQQAAEEDAGVQLAVPVQESSGVANPGEQSDWSWGVEEARVASSKVDATILTQFALAYAVHKSFIFIRIPLTAAITPKIVRTLRGWGWNIGPPIRRKAKTLKQNTDQA